MKAVLKNNKLGHVLRRQDFVDFRFG